MSGMDKIRSKLEEMLDEYEKASRAAGACESLVELGHPDIARTNQGVKSVRNSISAALSISLYLTKFDTAYAPKRRRGWFKRAKRRYLGM